MVTQEARPSAREARTQSAVYTLPRDWDSLDQVLVPLLERVDPLTAAPQLLVITPDVESTVGLVAGAFARLGAQGIDILPATSAARSARLLKTDPARAVAGPPWVLRQLLSSSTLKLEGIKAVLFAWLDDAIEDGGETLADLEAVLGEVPKDAVRTLVVRGVTPAGERFIERHLHQARRVGTVGSATESRLPVSYQATPRAARATALRRVLDQVDPPSAMVLARDDRSEEEARAALHQLGYRRANDVVRVSRGEVPPNTHTVIFYDLPLNAAPLEHVAESRPARVVVLVEPRELDTLRRLTGGRATPLERTEGVARLSRADDLLQREIRTVLEAGFGRREISSIEPLLTEFDGAEIAGALIRLLEADRERFARERASGVAKSGDRRDRPAPRSGGRDAGSSARPRGRDERPAPRSGERDSRPGARPGGRDSRSGPGGRDTRPGRGKPQRDGGQDRRRGPQR